MVSQWSVSSIETLPGGTSSPSISSGPNGYCIKYCIIKQISKRDKNIQARKHLPVPTTILKSNGRSLTVKGFSRIKLSFPLQTNNASCFIVHLACHTRGILSPFVNTRPDMLCKLFHQLSLAQKFSYESGSFPKIILGGIKFQDLAYCTLNITTDAYI